MVRHGEGRSTRPGRMDHRSVHVIERSVSEHRDLPAFLGRHAEKTSIIRRIGAIAGYPMIQYRPHNV